MPNLGSVAANRQRKAGVLALILQSSVQRQGRFPEARVMAAFTRALTDDQWREIIEPTSLKMPSPDTRRAVAETFDDLAAAECGFVLQPARLQVVR